jgi:hypothetical protein
MTDDHDEDTWALSPVILTVVTLVAICSALFVVHSRNTLTNCLSSWVEESAKTSTMRSEASEKRDKAQVERDAALRILVDRRSKQGLPFDDAQVQKAADDYATADDEYIKASKELQASRNNNPIPQFKDYCKKADR